MRICVSSNDSELNRLCREFVTTHCDPAIELVLSAPDEIRPGADAYIIDFTPGEEPPGNFSDQELSKVVFVLERSELTMFRQSVSRLPLTVLLKPVNRARLEIVLDQLFSQTNGDGCAEMLRTDRDKLLQDLLEANVRLQEYDQDRTNFIGRAVHEFRAPLTSMNGYCGLLLSGSLGSLSPEQREAIERMRHSMGRLSRLTSTLFTLSVGDKVDRPPNLEKGDIIGCIEQTLQIVSPLYQDRRINLEWEHKKPAGDLHFAHDQIEQVLINLLENACKFSPKGGFIKVRAYPYFWERRIARGWPPAGADRRRRATHESNSYCVEITDNGPGIPPEHVDSIFEEYTRYAGGDDRSGAGLGLAICRLILQTHGGRIWAESNPGGAKFLFVLPYVVSRGSSGQTAGNHSG